MLTIKTLSEIHAAIYKRNSKINFVNSFAEEKSKYVGHSDDNMAIFDPKTQNED